jgi:hypothetical protein
MPGMFGKVAPPGPGTDGQRQTWEEFTRVRNLELLRRLGLRGPCYESVSDGEKDRYHSDKETGRAFKEPAELSPSHHATSCRSSFPVHSRQSWSYSQSLQSQHPRLGMKTPARIPTRTSLATWNRRS